MPWVYHDMSFACKHFFVCISLCPMRFLRNLCHTDVKLTAYCALIHLIAKRISSRTGDVYGTHVHKIYLVNKSHRTLTGGKSLRTFNAIFNSGHASKHNSLLSFRELHIHKYTFFLSKQISINSLRIKFHCE